MRSQNSHQATESLGNMASVETNDVDDLGLNRDLGTVPHLTGKSRARMLQLACLDHETWTRSSSGVEILTVLLGKQTSHCRRSS